MSYTDNDLEKILNHFGNPEQSEFDPSNMDILDTHFLLEDVTCDNILGQTCECYANLLVPKKPLFTGDFGDENTPQMGSLVEANRWLRKEEKFLPSSLLMTSIINRLFDQSITFSELPARIDDDEKYQWICNVLSQNPYLMTNTIIDYDNTTVVHYPGVGKLQSNSMHTIENDLNEENQSNFSHISSRFSDGIPLYSPTKTEDDMMLLKALFGVSNLKQFTDMGDSLGLDYLIKPNISRTGVKGVTMSGNLFGDNDFDDRKPFIYCIDPSRGDLYDL